MRDNEDETQFQIERADLQFIGNVVSEELATLVELALSRTDEAYPEKNRAYIKALILSDLSVDLMAAANVYWNRTEDPEFLAAWLNEVAARKESIEKAMAGEDPCVPLN